MKKTLPLLVLGFAIALCVQACGENEEKAGEAKVSLAVTPAAAKNEIAFGHDVVFEVQASGEVKAEIANVSWAQVSVGQSENNITPVTVSLDANDDPQPRSCNLTVSAGGKTVTVPIGQSVLSSMIGSGSDVSIIGHSDAVLTFKLSKDWTVSLLTTRALPDWLTVEPAEGKGGERVDLHFHPDFFNLATESREAYARVSIEDGSFFYFHITQDSSLPEAGFLEKTSYGYYNYDGAGASVEFDALAHQSAVIRNSEETIFRLIWPAKERFFDFNGVPADVAEKDVFDLNLFYSWTSSAGIEEDHTVGVVKITPELIYALDDEKRGYIFKNLK